MAQGTCSDMTSYIWRKLPKNILHNPQYVVYSYTVYNIQLYTHHTQHAVSYTGVLGEIPLATRLWATVRKINVKGTDTKFAITTPIPPQLL